MGSSSRTPNAPGTLPFVDGAFGQQIAELRREIEGIQELNTIYRKRKPHGHGSRASEEGQHSHLCESLSHRRQAPSSYYRAVLPEFKTISPQSLRASLAVTPYPYPSTVTFELIPEFNQTGAAVQTDGFVPLPFLRSKILSRRSRQYH
jgi:hypothetical protein